MTYVTKELREDAASIMQEYVDKIDSFVGNVAGQCDELMEEIQRIQDEHPIAGAEHVFHARIDNLGELNMRFTGDETIYSMVYVLMRKRGFTPSSQMGADKKDSFSCWWTRENFPTIYLSFSSLVCERKIIGTRTVEEPIYEITCS